MKAGLRRACAAFTFVAVSAMGQQEDLTGKWRLALDTGRAIDYGMLEFVDGGTDDASGTDGTSGTGGTSGTDGSLSAYIDGGPVNILRLEGSNVTVDFDWTDGGDRLHITELAGTLADGRISGTLSEAGEPTGTWSAQPWEDHPDAGQPPQPIDLSGVWSSTSRGTHKDAFDLTPAARQINDAYDPTMDDPHLRCVSGGMIRMEDGPFLYEIVRHDDHLLILYEYFNETRRIWTDGREFPEGVENAWLPMGYSIGHWEGSTLVVETRGMKPGVWDAAGMPISPSAVVTERKYLDGEGRLHTDYWLRDPENYRRDVYRHAYRTQNGDAFPGNYACDPHSFYRSLDLEDRLDEYWPRSGIRF